MPAIEYYDQQELRRLLCDNCGHDWAPKVTSPKQCPQCKTPTKLEDTIPTTCQWLSDDEAGSLCDDCGVEVAVVKHEGMKLGVRCLRKLRMI